MRQLFLDFLSAIVFLALYALTENLYLATGVAVAVSLTQIAIAKLRGEQVDAMQWLVLFLVLVLGGATLLANDGRFIMLKSSISHSAIGIVMLRPGWMGRYLPPIVTDNLSKQFVVARGLLLGGVVLRARGGKSRRRVELRFSVSGRGSSSSASSAARSWQWSCNMRSSAPPSSASCARRPRRRPSSRQ